MNRRLLDTHQIRRLADDVRDKIIARESLIADVEGKILIEVFLTDGHHDIKLTVTTR